MALSELNRDDEAIGEFKLAFKKRPQSVPALDWLGQALISQKRYSAAIAYLKDDTPTPGYKTT
jgi:predicted Zn-dependent protease